MSVLNVFDQLRNFVRVKTLVDHPIIDNLNFRLHYQVTTTFLIASCLVVTANNFIGKLTRIFKRISFKFVVLGEAISCINQEWSLPTHVINTYCWISSTFTLPPYQNSTISNVEFTLLGSEFGHDKKFHNYYQWVPFALFFHVSC